MSNSTNNNDESLFDSENEMEEVWKDNESIIEKRCEETDVLIVKPDAMRVRRMYGKKRIIDTIIGTGCFDKHVDF
eukprot:7067686-Ditylum_brightwellii.AAC.1